MPGVRTDSIVSPGQLLGEATGGDLHLGQLGHGVHVSLHRRGSVDRAGGGGDRAPCAARAGGAGGGVVAVRRRARRERVRVACAPRCCPTRRRSSACRARRPGHAEDLVVRLHGTGTRKVLLVGHIDTVVAHAEHKPLRARGRAARRLRRGRHEGRRRARASARCARSPSAPSCYARARAAARVRRGVADGRLRPRRSASRASTRACASRPASSRGGDEGVVVRRKAAGTIHVTAHGRTAHSRLRARPRRATRCWRWPRAAQAVAARARRPTARPT